MKARVSRGQSRRGTALRDAEEYAAGISSGYRRRNPRRCRRIAASFRKASLPANADFNGATDNVASYGVAALIAGSVATKAGFFKGLWLAILALKKFIIVGLIALGVGIKKWVTGRKKGEEFR